MLKGNHAVSHGVKLSRVQVVSAYPITPQTTIVEELSEMCATGELDARFIKVESKHSAMAALLGASTAGVRTFTATSGNGLLYMHEVLHWAAGARLPIVLANVNRAVGGTWNIWADQTDSLSQRDTGWIQLYCESNQEVLDSVVMAFKLAESVLLPVMIAYDAFFLSHTSEVVDVPEPEDVDRFLPPYRPETKIDFDNPRMFGGLMSPDFFYEQRYKMHRDSVSALDRYREICGEFSEIFQRDYDLVEEYRADDAELIIATAGTITSVTRLAVDQLRESGIKAGLMKVRLFRPVPAERWRSVLGKAKKIAVIDRNLSVGCGGVFAAEVQAALFPPASRPLVFPVIAGLGGRDVTPRDIIGIAKAVLAREGPSETPLFWGLRE
ncbi:MAG: pyruvate ferredoxin oxidoreductase [Pseudomonadota bacterium]